MALVVKDRVQETTTTTGTGTITLAGAVSGFQSFSVIGNGNTTYYSITGGAEWEIGIGTYTSSGTTLSRDTVLESSNSGSLVNFSAGSKTVFCTYPAERSLYVDGTTITAASTATLPVASGGTGSATATFSGANITSLNASNISAGTIGNSYTTAASANGASTIVARDATGNFSANTITATLSGNATNVSGTVAVGNGGTGSTTLTAEAVIIGNTTSAVKFVSPGTAGNVLTSNGTVWASTAPSGGGVTSLNGQTGAITDTGLGNIGSFMPLMRAATAVSSNFRSVIGTTYAGSGLRYNYTIMNQVYNEFQSNTAGGAGYALGGTAPSGTWRCIGRDVFYRNGCDGVWGVGLFVRVS